MSDKQVARIAWVLWAEDNAIGWIYTAEQIRELYVRCLGEEAKK